MPHREHHGISLALLSLRHFRLLAFFQVPDQPARRAPSSQYLSVEILFSTVPCPPQNRYPHYSKADVRYVPLPMHMYQALVCHNPTARGSLSIDAFPLFLLHIDYTVLPPEKSTFISKTTAISILVCIVTSFRQGSHVPLHRRLRRCYLRSCFKSSSGVVMGAMPKFSTR